MTGGWRQGGEEAGCTANKTITESSSATTATTTTKSQAIESIQLHSEKQRGS